MGKDDDLVVDIDDLDTVQVAVDDGTKTAQEPDHIKKEVEAKKKERTRRVNPQPDVPEGPTPEQALEEAKAFAKTQEEARRAAEATALSERQLREQAQRQALQAQQEAEQSRERADNSELANIENGIAAAQKELESHEAEYVRCAEAGEFAKMGALQSKIARAGAALDRLETAKANFDPEKRPKTAEGRVVAPQPAQQNAFEQYVSGFAPAAQNWIRQHPDCVPAQVGGNAAKNAMMMQGHYAALAKSIPEGTTEYFKVIDDHVNPQQATVTTQQNNTSKAAEIQVAGETQQRAAPRAQPTAPPTRDANPGSAQSGSRAVTLTKEQQEMAKLSFPHLTDKEAFGNYARNLIELQAEGKIGRTTH
jgi:hypothetical protein